MMNIIIAPWMLWINVIGFSTGTGSQPTSSQVVIPAASLADCKTMAAVVIAQNEQLRNDVIANGGYYFRHKEACLATGSK